MIDKRIKKGLVVAVIFLFIVVSFQPIIAKDTILLEKKSNTKELLETIKYIANNQEIQSIIQKSEIKGSPIRFKQLRGRLQKEIIGVIENNDELDGILKKLSDFPCDCEKDNTTRLWHFPVLCTLLLPLFILGVALAIGIPHDPSLLETMLAIGSVLKCFWIYI